MRTMAGIAKHLNISIETFRKVREENPKLRSIIHENKGMGDRHIRFWAWSSDLDAWDEDRL